MTHEERLLRKHGFERAECVHGAILIVSAASPAYANQRDTADSQCMYMLDGRRNLSALKVAKEIDTYGAPEVARLVEFKALIPAPQNKADHQPKSGHGVCVIYTRTGRTRTVRAYD